MNDIASLPTSQFDTAHASAIQYATKAPQFHVRFEGGIGSKSALDLFFDFAKELSSWCTSRLKLNPNRRLTGASTCPGSESEVTPKSFLVSEPFDCILVSGRESAAPGQLIEAD